ncbi:protein scabrous-like [Teleopsis dalmanni]|uniref:protein scabrous-like n=1 Tax=Teleopsis dalmanni TaxID=139649 RepID=UPI0018CEAF61|nr:protein scabrous-like [Teleopsis dalmanni]
MYGLNTESLADHKRRHCHFQRQEIHELQLAQRSMRRKLNELKYHRIDERVRSIEIEQHRLADANFNLSRQIATLDKLHLSMLELLEDVEGLQTKIDKNVPELRHEISKLEFTNAQLTSEQNMLREESKNMARSIQAMAMSVSTLQDERDGVRKMETTVTKLQAQVDRSQSVLQDVQRALTHHRRADNKLQQYGIDFNDELENNTNSVNNTNNTNLSQNAETLVEKLEKVELQYESIINKLPQDCSDVAQSTEGLYLIAPAGQHHPLMAHCTADGWTTVQRRYDGSADFNRSWEDYAAGFGTPAGEYWIGNEQLHHLTVNNCTELRIIMQDIYDNVWQAQYSNFYIASRADGFRLHISGYRGNASDALDYQQGMQFSAIDVDRDISQTHCAANYEGGWWFSHCQHANLNGRYNLGLTWFDASRNEWIAVKSSQMQIKRQSAAVCAYRNAKRYAATASDVTSATTIISSEVPTTTTTATYSSGVQV